MKTQFQILKSIIDQLDEFYKESGNEDISEERFILWLHEKNILLKQKSLSPSDESHIGGEIVFHIDALGKKYKSFSKEALSGSGLKTSDEYSFLAHLAHFSSLKKMDIINMHYLAKPSGIEIINRLLSKNLISEFPDPDDSRAKRIKLTPEGTNILKLVNNKMMQVYEGMTEDLAMEEKIRLKEILQVMNSLLNMDEIQ